MPQKKPRGKAISEDAANWRTPLDALAAVDAALASLKELLQAEKKPAGSAAARLAPRADRTNSRRVRRKKGGSCDRVVKFVASVVFDELSVLLPSQRIVKRFEKTAQRKLCPEQQSVRHSQLLWIHRVEHLPQSVGCGFVDRIAISGVGGFVKEKFATAVAVGVDRIDQVQLWIHVEVEAIGHAGI